jgi:hypothetical protein
MFNSLASAAIPICLLSALAGIALGRWRQRSLAMLFAVLAVIAISSAWWWLPMLLWPQEHTDPQGGWGLVAVFYWSLFAIPVAVVTLLITSRRFARKQGNAA